GGVGGGARPRRGARPGAGRGVFFARRPRVGTDFLPVGTATGPGRDPDRAWGSCPEPVASQGAPDGRARRDEAQGARRNAAPAARSRGPLSPSGGGKPGGFALRRARLGADRRAGATGSAGRGAPADALLGFSPPSARRRKPPSRGLGGQTPARNASPAVRRRTAARRSRRLAHPPGHAGAERLPAVPRARL